MPHAGVLRYERKTDRGTAKQRERVIQVALAGYINSHYPDVIFFNDWAAGAYLTSGQNKSRLRMNPKTGWPDLFIAHPGRGYSGLFLELKKEGTTIYKKDGTLVANKQIRLEARVLELLEAQGYCARFGVGYEKAAEFIDRYMGMPTPNALEF